MAVCTAKRVMQRHYRRFAKATLCTCLSAARPRSGVWENVAHRSKIGASPEVSAVSGSEPRKQRFVKREPGGAVVGELEQGLGRHRQRDQPLNRSCLSTIKAMTAT